MPGTEPLRGDSKGVLFISYSGMLEPLGQSQVLAYQERLAAQRVTHLISFERAEDWAKVDERDAVAARIRDAGIQWHPRRYHKRPSALATAWDILAGSQLGTRLVRRHQLGIVHSRSYVASAMALRIQRATGARFLFDMRGFWADERVDGGLWPRDGRMYKIAKSFERRFLIRADHVVSLTNAAAREIETFPYLAGRTPPVTVIPTCADLRRFRPGGKVSGDSFVLGYVGSAGTWYLFDAVAESFRCLRRIRPDARLLVINRNDHPYIRERLAAAGVPMDTVELKAARHAEVHLEMARMDAGIFFYKPSYSRAACSPTKLGEFLGCGIPCLSNSGVGDMADVLLQDNVGVTVDSFDAEALCVGVAQLVNLAEQPDVRERCAAAAQRHFSLERGVERYAEVYRQLESQS